MKRSTYLMLFLALLGAGYTASGASDKKPIPTEQPGARSSYMSDDKAMRDLFDRWEQVWHEGKFDLVPNCVAQQYIRHDQKGDRTVTRESYAAEIAKTQEERPGIRVVVYDHSFEGSRAWFRFAFKWNDPKTHEAHTQAGMQSYRVADGKLVETWLTLLPLGSAWSDPIAQEHWTSPTPMK